MKKTPLATVTERFSDKAGLIKAVKELSTDELWITRTNEDKGLERVSNAKLLHLHEVLSTVKKEWGSRGKLIDATLAALDRAKDTTYRTRLEKFSTPRLLDAYRTAAKAKKAASAA